MLTCFYVHYMFEGVIIFRYRACNIISSSMGWKECGTDNIWWHIKKQFYQGYSIIALYFLPHFLGFNFFLQTLVKRIQTKISFDVRSGVNKNFTVKYVHPGISSCGYWLKILEILKHKEWLIHYIYDEMVNDYISISVSIRIMPTLALKARSVKTKYFTVQRTSILLSASQIVDR